MFIFLLFLKLFLFSGKSTEQQAWAKRGKTIRRGGAVQAAINDPVQYFRGSPLDQIAVQNH